MVNITQTIEPNTGTRWRAWLQKHHANTREIWLLYRLGKDGGLTYLDAVEEALCFGWIDGLAKKMGEFNAQRFTPRRAGGNWTELNKQRVRRLMEAGLMTPAGLAVAPDLNAPFVLSAGTEKRLKKDPAVWTAWCAFPELYRRVRGSYVDEMLKREDVEYEKRLANLIKQTRAGKMFGNWDDSGMKRS